MRRGASSRHNQHKRRGNVRAEGQGLGSGARRLRTGRGGVRMARASQAALTVQAVVFGFDPDPGTPSARALQVLTVRTGVPTADVERGETCAEAALRACTEAGLDLEAG